MHAASRFQPAAIGLLSLVLALPFPLMAAPPRVLSTQPANGDQEVSTDVKEIVIAFDQDMNTTGYSFVGGGPSFPKVSGKPSWRDKRTCVLPVELAAGHAYTIGINSATHTAFKNLANEPALPTQLRFQTKGAGAQAEGMKGAAVVAPADHAKAVAQLREAIDQRYSYRDVHRVHWAETWKTFEPRLQAAGSSRAFAEVAGEMLAATQDAHIWLMEGGQIVPAFRRMATPNANPKLLPLLVSGWIQRHPAVASGKLADDVGYIAIHSWEKKHQPQALEAALAALKDLRDLPALVVDVRFNSGGDELSARSFAGCFVRDRSLYAKHVLRDATAASGFSAPMERWLEPSAQGPAYAGRVAVLMGPVNMSSAEAFLLMMRQVPGCKLVGQRSYGASGNPQPHVLANGVTVYLPSWKAMLPDGADLELKGVAPDIEVKTAGKDFTQRDPVLEKALEILKP